MNNIYLTKEGCFDENNNFVNLSYDLVLSWVKHYKLSEKQTKDFTIELSVGKEKNRYRTHIWHSYHGWNAALRLLPSSIISFDDLGVDKDEVISVCSGSGLTLFCGPTGAGKSTTMNTVIDALLRINKLGITITIEDPVEYLHNKKSIFQREIGKDCISFEQGLIEAMRMTPKTIVIGEIRNKNTAVEAVRAGLNGHRVFATLHATNIQEAIARLWGFLDDQEDSLLVESMQGVITQHLVVMGGVKYCVYETLKIDAKTKTILHDILDGKTNISLSYLSNAQHDQKRESLKDKKQQLIKGGFDEDKLYAIND